ncbi:hypothetical protein TrVFT333_008293 [Trichoderma virens FT-333]|nr:hypothetical protein TrVFT333_008293 [Trichoderma virens FT-333]
MAELEIESLHFTNPSMRSFNLDISAVIGPEVDIGWISCVTVSIFYRRVLIGKKTLRNKYINPDEEGNVEIHLENLKILNMLGFKAFIQRLMPKTGVIPQNKDQTSITATLDHDESGHKLSVAIDLNDTSSVSISDVDLQRVDRTVTLKFRASSPNPVDLPFGYCRFSLKKDGAHLVSLEGYFDILPGNSDVTLEGDTETDNLELSGTAILKGVCALDNEHNWLAHAIRLFEMEVKLG